jgi:PAS domain S-box-containing protein
MKYTPTLDQEFLSTLTVLYVEDDADTRAQFSEFLSRPVGTLITAANGSEGFDAFLEHEPDIIITDIHMPVMDGLTMARQIRKISQTVPIIVLTAFEQADYLRQAVDIGIDRYVTKPVNSQILLETMVKTAHTLRAEEQLNLKQKWDLTEMAMHNQTLHSQLSIILGLSPDGIIFGDPRGFITCTNQRMADMIGYQVEELIGNDYLEYVHRDDFTNIMEKQQQLQAGEIRTIDTECRFIRKDGSEFRGHLTARHFEAECASQNGLVCLITDISKQTPDTTTF